MTNYELLRATIKELGLPMTAIAARSGISRVTLYHRLDGRGEFKASEIAGLTKALKLTKAQRDAIFFSS